MKAILFCFSLATAMHLSAQWNSDPKMNNPVCTADGYQRKVKTVSDGAGGIILTWEDYRKGFQAYDSSDIYAQHINVNGLSLWPKNGLLICSALKDQKFAAITSDGNGGAIIVWEDRRSNGPPTWDLYAQRVDANGNIKWMHDGVFVYSGVYDQDLQVISDANGGAIITWVDSRNGSSNLYAQRINANGQLLWNPNGVAVYKELFDQNDPAMISTNDRGAIITWTDFRSGDGNIYAQELDSNGALKWNASGIAICTAINGQGFTQIVNIEKKGSIIAWIDGRDVNTSSIYAQRIDSNGTSVWTTDGIQLDSSPGYKYFLHMINDNSNGAIMAWQDSRNGNYDIYAQHADGSGNVLWTKEGVAVGSTPEIQEYPVMTKDNNGGAIIAWADNRNELSSAEDIYAQNLDVNGNAKWMPNGNVVSSARYVQEFPEIIGDGGQGAIVAWVDTRKEKVFDLDIYTSKIANGVLPVQLISFYGTQKNNSNILNWITASAPDNYGFYIERSIDGSSFQKIGFIPAGSNSSQTNSYSFTDMKPLSENYYRLKQTDTDGKFVYSQTIKLENPQKNKFFVFPNPASEIIFTTNTETTQIFITNISGKILMSVLVTGNMTSINISKLSSGLYYCKNGKSTVAFVKVK